MRKMLGCAKLTPLQSRLAASVVSLAMIALLYWSLSSPTFAYAAELSVDGAGASRGGHDHNWHRIEHERLLEDGLDDDLEVRASAAPTAPPMIIGGNNVGNTDNIQAGNTTVWSYSRALLYGNFTPSGPGLPPDVSLEGGRKGEHKELRKRAGNDAEQASGGPRRIYVSINTCVQPTWNGTGVQTAPPPQLTLYVSTQGSNQSPGPDVNDGSQVVRELFDGFANVTVEADSMWYMAVHAPALPPDFIDVWNYELAVSIDDFYHHAYPNITNLYLIDADSASALLVTNNLTHSGPKSPSYKAWMDLSPPYIAFASNENFTRTLGLSNSFCGLNKISQIVGDQNDPLGISHPVNMEMTTRGLGIEPKERLYITQLNSSSSYNAMLALVGNSTASGDGVVGGGGSVWAPVHFNTKADGNCALIFNLTFCKDVAYAAPSTPSFAENLTNLHAFYDNYTHYYYQQFNYSLQQIPCDTTAAAQYSLATNCDQCADAYKNWLCAVSIPRCEDFTRPASDSWLQPRNMAQHFYNNRSTLSESLLQSHFVPMADAPTLEGTPAFSQTYMSSLATNSSRNIQIDQVIGPGPYKEVLPCDSLCYNLARSCPAALGFTCPAPGRGLEMGYGKRNPTGNGTITCNYPGAYVLISAGRKTDTQFLSMTWSASMIAVLFLVLS